MATNIISGACDLQIEGYETLGGTPNLNPGIFANIAFNETITTTTGVGRVCPTGTQADISEEITKREYVLEVKGQAYDDTTLEFISSRLYAPSTDVIVPRGIDFTVPASAPYEVSVAAKITTLLGNLNSLSITLLAEIGLPATGLHRLRRVTGVPADGEYMVDLTTPGSEKIVFNALQAGAVARRSFDETLTGARQTLGVEANPTQMNFYRFSGILKSGGFPFGQKLIIPKMQITSGFNFDSSASPPEYTLTYKALLAAGKNSQYQLITLKAGDL